MKLEDINSLTDVEQVEKIKLLLDYERTRIDRLKTWLTALSIAIPLFAGAVTVGFGVWSENQRAKTSFEIKAIEIVLNAQSPEGATNKAIVLSELFPDRLPHDFKEKMIRMYGKPTPYPGR